MPSDPLIVTLALDEASFAFFDRQRRRYFPPERNFIPAHVTLFHALPGEELRKVLTTLEQVCGPEAPFDIAVTGLRSLGRGVAYTLDAPELGRIRSSLAGRWSAFLTPQDRQKHSPHVTVQNKVDPATARTTLAELQAAFQPFTARGEGLHLWWYRGGPWEPIRTFRFGKAGPSASG
jgi:2'-5' RNA ligase